MKISIKETDAVVLTELGKRLTTARLSHNLTQSQLADQAGVSKRTVERLEAGAVAAQLSGFIRVCRALNLLDRFDLLLPETGPSPMTQLKLRGKERRRASRTNTKKSPVRKWQWGDES